MAEKRYQDYVIKDVEFVGDFEGMYRDCENPWLQSDDDNVFDSRRAIAETWIKKISKKTNVQVCEIGCGFGHITAELTKEGISCVGSDISPTAIRKAKELNKDCEFVVASFDDFDFYASKQINVFLMAEVTWYVLPQLKNFLQELTKYRAEVDAPIYLIHLLATYAEGVQKYGSDYFTDLEGILSYFGLNYLEYGYIVGGKEYDSQSRGTYFVAKI